MSGFGEMFEVDGEGQDEEDLFPLDDAGVETFLLWWAEHAHEVVGAAAAGARPPAGGGGRRRWMRWRVDPRLLFHRLRVRLALWRQSVVGWWEDWERVDWPLVRRGLLAFAQSFVGMMLLVLRDQDYHFLPRLRYPFELPRDSYLRRLQIAVRLSGDVLLRFLCLMHGTSGVIAALVGLRVHMDVGRYLVLDFFNVLQLPEAGAAGGQGLPVAAVREDTLRIRLGEGHELVVRGRIRWGLLLAAMVLIVGVVFLINPTFQDQEPPAT